MHEDYRNEIMRKLLDEAICKRECRRMKLMQELEIISCELDVLTREFNMLPDHEYPQSEEAIYTGTRKVGKASKAND